jgi:hypothetical protein
MLDSCYIYDFFQFFNLQFWAGFIHLCVTYESLSAEDIYTRRFSLSAYSTVMYIQSFCAAGGFSMVDP